MRVTLFPPNADRATRIFYSGVMVFLTAFIIFFLHPILPIGGPFGYLAAQREVSHGQLAYALPMRDSGWEKEWKELLQNTYGIHVNARVHSCLVGDFQATYDAAYNRIQLAAIRQAYGFDVIATTRELAYREWRAKAEAAPRPAGPSVSFSPALSEADLVAVRTITPDPAFPPAVEPLAFSPRPVPYSTPTLRPIP